MTPPTRVKVAVAGFGRLASDLCRGLGTRDDVEIVGIARRTASGPVRIAEYDVPVFASVEALLANALPEVLLEATLPEFALLHARQALSVGVRPIVATSGLSDDDLSGLREFAMMARVGAVVAPNLSIGAVVLMHLAAIASRYFDHADIIEYHRDRKADAPSGTAVHTARLMQQARTTGFHHVASRTVTVPGVRGGEVGGIGMHSVRLPGLVAHQEVIFGDIGQTLTLRHDAMSNDSYIPGATLAIRHVMGTTGLTVGLGALLGLEL